MILYAICFTRATRHRFSRSITRSHSTESLIEEWSCICPHQEQGDFRLTGAVTVRRSVWPAIFLVLVPLIAWGVGTPAQRVRTATLEQQKGPGSKRWPVLRGSWTSFTSARGLPAFPCSLRRLWRRPIRSFLLPREARKLQLVSSSEPTVAFTVLSSCRALDWQAIAMYCRPYVPGNIALRPATACRRRSKGKSSFPADSSLPRCWARMSQQRSDSIRGQRQEKSQIL